jgi:hypothetical protein
MPQCVECCREKNPGEKGWVTVLAQSRTLRIHYCPECITDLVDRAAGRAEDGDE